MSKKFEAQVADWVIETEGVLLAVVRASIQRLVDKVQQPVAKGGNMPVDTGWLRKSFQVTLNVPATGLVDNPGGTHLWNDTDTIMAIAGLELGDTIYGMFTAKYAIYVEYGHGNVPPRGMVRKAAQQWNAIVNDVVAGIS